MLLFACLPDSESDNIHQTGIPASAESPLLATRDVHEALRNCRTRNILLVISSFALEKGGIPFNSTDSGDIHVTGNIPADAILNVNPYVPVKPVGAAGGLIVRETAGGLNILLIFRKGVWDLPKGKLDDGESPTEGALREVREEIGIEQLELVRPLDHTVHGYRDDSHYVAKTTHWYLMRTPENEFRPQTSESIEQVAWFPWPIARNFLGYLLLRRLLDRVEHLV